MGEVLQLRWLEATRPAYPSFGYRPCIRSFRKLPTSGETGCSSSCWCRCSSLLRAKLRVCTRALRQAAWTQRSQPSSLPPHRPVMPWPSPTLWLCGTQFRRHPLAVQCLPPCLLVCPLSLQSLPRFPLLMWPLCLQPLLATASPQQQASLPQQQRPWHRLSATASPKQQASLPQLQPRPRQRRRSPLPQQQPRPRQHRGWPQPPSCPVCGKCFSTSRRSWRRCGNGMMSCRISATLLSLLTAAQCGMSSWATCAATSSSWSSNSSRWLHMLIQRQAASQRMGAGRIPHSRPAAISATSRPERAMRCSACRLVGGWRVGVKGDAFQLLVCLAAVG